MIAFGLAKPPDVNTPRARSVVVVPLPQLYRAPVAGVPELACCDTTVTFVPSPYVGVVSPAADIWKSVGMEAVALVPIESKLVTTGVLNALRTTAFAA